MSKHVLYEIKGFKNSPQDEENMLYDVVVLGGLAVCKRCGEFEAGLGNMCIPKAAPLN